MLMSLHSVKKSAFLPGPSAPTPSKENLVSASLGLSDTNLRHWGESSCPGKAQELKTGSPLIGRREMNTYIGWARQGKGRISQELGWKGESRACSQAAARIMRCVLRGQVYMCASVCAHTYACEMQINSSLIRLLKDSGAHYALSSGRKFK